MSNLTERLRAWSYQRQLLNRQGDSLQDVLHHVIGVYSTHPSGPLSLLARSTSFTQESFYDLDHKIRGLRIPAMRLSIHLVAAENAAKIISATVPGAEDPIWQKRYSQKGRDISEASYREWKKVLLKLCASPRTAAEVKEATDIPADRIKTMLNFLAYQGLLLRIGAENLRSNIIRYVETKTWCQDQLDRGDEDEALVWLASAYLKAFGPARIKDFQWWAGITTTRAKMAFADLEVTDIGDGHLLPSTDLADFETVQAIPKNAIDLLPQWDAYTMGYAPDGRARLVDADKQDQVYGAIGATGGNAMPVILLKGKAIGTWHPKFAGPKMQVEVRFFSPQVKKVTEVINNKLNEIAGFLGARRVVAAGF